MSERTTKSCGCKVVVSNHGATKILLSISKCPLHENANELLEALLALRSFMWAEGYADQNVPMAQADAAIAKAEAD